MLGAARRAWRSSSANPQPDAARPRGDAPAVTAHLLQTLPVVDLTVEDPPIEAVIDQIYKEGRL